MLNLPKGCKLYSAFITLTATEEKSRNIRHLVISVNIENNCTKLENISSSPDIIPIHINNIPIDSPNLVKEELKKKQSKKIKAFKLQVF